MSDLVGNPEDRFSHVAAHLLHTNTTDADRIILQVISNMIGF